MPAVFQQIYSKIDTDKDDKLQPEELKTALQNEEIRDQWSKLIAYHPSEWQLDTRSILARFTQLLTNPLAPPEKVLQAQALLAHETQKMNTLTFLEQVVPPISPTPMLYHFHPVAFVEFMDKKQKQKINKNISKEEFVRTVFEAAKIEESQSGVPAAITTAQAILETGYGKSVPEDIDTGKYSYNLFGIKAHGNPSYVTVWTHEVVNGNRIKIKDKFMAYNSFEESIKGRTDFFNKNKRYHFLFNSKDPDYWADGLQSSGYATDPNYAKVLKQIMTQWKLR